MAIVNRAGPKSGRIAFLSFSAYGTYIIGLEFQQRCFWPRILQIQNLVIVNNRLVVDSNDKLDDKRDAVDAERECLGTSGKEGSFCGARFAVVFARKRAPGNLSKLFYTRPETPPIKISGTGLIG